MSSNKIAVHVLHERVVFDLMRANDEEKEVVEGLTVCIVQRKCMES